MSSVVIRNSGVGEQSPDLRPLMPATTAMLFAMCSGIEAIVEIILVSVLLCCLCYLGALVSISGVQWLFVLLLCPPTDNAAILPIMHLTEQRF